MRVYMTNSPLKKWKSKIATFKVSFKELGIALLIIAFATFPYLHDILPLSKSETFHGFSSMRVFSFMLLINVYSHLGWLIAFFLAKGKSYRFALLVPIGLSAYQISIILFNLKKTELNSINIKFILFITLSLFVVIHYFKNAKR